MQSINQPDKTTDDLDAQRAILTKSINDVAGEIGIALKDTGLHFPVHISVRTSGDSLATIATPLDPSDNDWKHAMAIDCEVTGRRVGAKKLHGRELIYAGANAARISASELVHDETSSDLSQ